MPGTRIIFCPAVILFKRYQGPSHYLIPAIPRHRTILDESRDLILRGSEQASNIRSF
jgi:hypothetical protein